MKNDLVALLKAQNNQAVIDSHRRLISFIDAALSQAFRMSGDDQIEFLFKNMTSLKDFMRSEIITDQTKSNIGEVVIDMFDKFVEESNLDLEELAEVRRKKKESELEGQQQLQESLSETDQSTLSIKEE